MSVKSSKSSVETMTHKLSDKLIIEAPLTLYAYGSIQEKPDSQLFDSYTKSGHVCLLVHAEGSSDVAELYLMNESSPPCQKTDFFPDLTGSLAVRKLMYEEIDGLSKFISEITGMSENNIGILLNDVIERPTKTSPARRVNFDGGYTDALKQLIDNIDELAATDRMLNIQDIIDVSFHVSDELAAAPTEFFVDCKNAFSRYVEKHGIAGRDAELAGACLTGIMTKLNVGASSDEKSRLPEILGVPDASIETALTAETIKDYLRISDFTKSEVFRTLLTGDALETIDSSTENLSAGIAYTFNLKLASDASNDVLSVISMRDDTDYMRTQNAKMLRPDIGEFSDGDWCATQRMDVLRRFHDAGKWGISFEDKMRRAVFSSMIPGYSRRSEDSFLNNKQDELRASVLARQTTLAMRHPELGTDAILDGVVKEMDALSQKIVSAYEPKQPKTTHTLER